MIAELSKGRHRFERNPGEHNEIVLDIGLRLAQSWAEVHQSSDPTSEARSARPTQQPHYDNGVGNCALDQRLGRLMSTTGALDRAGLCHPE